MRKKTSLIYKSASHLWGTIFVLAVPFVFLLVFTSTAHIDQAPFFENVLISIIRMAIAYVISVVLGWVLAVSFYRGKRSDYVLPIFDVMQSLPTSAALPIAALYWGRTNTTVIFFLVVAMIWPILFSLVSSLKMMKHEWEESVEVGGLKGFAYLRYFLFPASIPAVVTGSIIGLGEGWEALVATEIIVGVQSGLGNFFQVFAGNSTITLLGILGLLLVIFSINRALWLPLLERSHRMVEE